MRQHADVAPPTLLDRRAVAEWLGVSTRWVERHLVPSLRARVGGKSWYRPDDIEKQLEIGQPCTSSAPRAGRAARSAPCASSSREALEVEAQLRASLAKPKRK